MRLGDFTIEFLGIEYPDCFQGYSSETYDYCAYGIGLSEGEALEECLYQLEFNEVDIQSIRDEYGPASDTIADHTHYDCIEAMPLWHIGIRYNFLEEKRFKRILRIENLEPLRFENYCLLETKAWSYITKADGSEFYGNFKSDDWPESAEAYLLSLRDDILESGELYFYVPYASGSDYSGSTIEAANYKYIKDKFEDEDWIHPIYGRHDTYAITVGLTGLLQSNRFEEFIEILEGLANYPVIDDEVLCQLEMDGADEAWASWVRDDFKSKIKNRYDAAEFEWPNNLRDFFEEKRKEANVYWECEEYGSNMYIDLDSVDAVVTWIDVEKWALKYEVNYQKIGAVIEIYYNQKDAIDRVNELKACCFLGAYYKEI